jgi:hypothetical protein
MNDEFENALAWFSAAPARWVASARKDMSAAGEWIWGVLQGDFNENASTSQTVISTVISMIPFVDQICDVRDMVANCKKITVEPKESWHWVALCLTLIGLFPTLGSLFKGCGKVMFAAIRKAGYVSGATPQIAKAIEEAIFQLNKFLARPEVRKALKGLKIDNPYKYLATRIRDLKAQMTVAKLLSAFDEAKKAAEALLNMVKKWGGTGLAAKATDLMKMIDNVHHAADRGIAWVLRPLQDLLERVAKRLDVESDVVHKAHLNVVNPHKFVRLTEEAEHQAFKEKVPPWARADGVKKFPRVGEAPHVPRGYPSFDDGPTKGAWDTFHTIDDVDLPPGTRLCRVLDPASGDNAICWMREEEFLKLHSKADWRKNFAVWTNWNSNGEVVTYVVPEGGLKVWEGITASQRMADTKYVLDGGAIQIVLDPNELKEASMSKRRLTNWGYDDMGGSISLVGVPVLTKNWIDWSKKK